ncbi:MAG: DNA primase [Rhodospirillales bacterium]|nr:DNA primase [Alphaproteobacteria bacterium]MBL6947202.1 DNA primase [Rhodospirillales bacterium]
MAFSDQFLEELRGRSGLADVVGRRVKLTRKGREHSGLCPFHKEKTPSFTVNEEKGFYHCFGCGEHGSVFDFVMQTEGLTFPEAVEKLAGEAGLEIPQDTPEERERQEQRKTLYDVTEAATRFFQSQLYGTNGKQALDYLKRRGLADETIKRFRLGFAPDGRTVLKEALAREGIDDGRMIATGLIIQPEDNSRNSYDRFRGRVIFPITDTRDRVIAFGGRILGDGEPKYLNSPETSLFHKGHVLYGQKTASGPARKAGLILVTEGYTDVIALHQAGFENAVAPLGTALTEDQMKILWKIVPEPVLCFDGDAAGQKAAARAAVRALPLLASGYGLRFALLPTGEDPDSLIKTGGAEAMSGVINAALPLSEVLWRMETGGRVPKTPEQRAALQKRLKDHALEITDSTLRSHFLALFNDRLWSGAKSRKDANVRGNSRANWQPSMALGEAPGGGLTGGGPTGGGASPDARRLAQQVLLAIIISHPDIFDHVEETLGNFSFAEGGLDQLRQELISVLLNDADLESDGVKDVLAQRGYAESLNVLFRDPMIQANRILRADAPAEKYQTLWDENVALLKTLETAPEVEKIRHAGDDGIAEEDWERQRALLEQAMHGDRN